MQLRSRTADEIQGWIIDHLTTTLGLTSTPVGAQTRLLDLGVDSLEAVGMAEALQSWLDVPVASTVVWEQPTIATLAQFLAGEPGDTRAGPRRAARTTPRVEPGDDPFATVINPDLAAMLGKLGLDRHYVRGQGTALYDEQGRRILDFVGAYGALPLGHNPPEIWSALQATRTAGAPAFVQPSLPPAAGRLAARLLSVCPAGLHRVTFANSGAEAVEAALKMCRMATGRSGVLSAQGSFHGKTLGALSATANPRYHAGTGAPVAGFDSVPFGDAQALREAFTRHPGRYAALLLEPVQGEGGIVEPPPGYLAQVRQLCDDAGVPLVLDEVQTGLGRTGAWFACDHEGVVPDAIVLAKALGGGLVPIGAVVSCRELATEAFGLKHSSTFAGGGVACAAALATLERIGANDSELVRQVAEYGERFKQGLQRVAARYPHLVSEVRGRGYLLGLHFAVNRRTWACSILAVAAEQGGLAPLFAGYMLNVERLRVAPTLNGTDVIRLEPPLTATWDELETALGALERGLQAFARGDAARVLHGIRTGVDRPRAAVRSRPPTRATARPRVGDGRFAFLLHPLELRSYADFDPTLRSLSIDELRQAVGCVHGLVPPAVVSEVRISSALGAHAYGELVMIGHTAAELAAMPHEQAVSTVRAGVQLARDRGARLVGLGAFTSIATHGGLAVNDLGVAITSGNSYTVAAAHGTVVAALGPSSSPGLLAGERSVAVIGAGGAIGRALCALLADDVDRLILVGNPRRAATQLRTRLLDVAAVACRHVIQHAARPKPGRGALARQILEDPECPPVGAPRAAFVALATRLVERGALVITADASASARKADVVVTATSATQGLIQAADLRPGAVVCEVSRPHNLAPAVRAARPDVRFVDGGVVEVPGRPDIGAFGLPPGHGYACMAETMTLALEQRYDHFSLGGELNLHEVRTVGALAARHGFRVVSRPPVPTITAASA